MESPLLDTNKSWSEDLAGDESIVRAGFILGSIREVGSLKQEKAESILSAELKGIIENVP